VQIHNFQRYTMLHGFSQEGSELQIGPWSASQLTRRYGTPLYVYDGAIIEEAYHLVERAFPQFEVFYSIKANPSLAICTLLRHLGSGAELASGGELHLASVAGFEPHKIVFAGPAKTDEELALAIRTGIASVNVESFSELKRLELIAKSEHKRVNACLRINTRESSVSTPEIMVGGPSKFGIDEELVFEELGNLDFKYVNIIGIHVYTASQILDVGSVISNLNRTLELASTCSRWEGFRLRFIVFGGGFGVPYDEHEQELKIPSLANKVSEMIRKSNYNYSISDIRLVLELGRFLVARAGVFLTRVTEVKKSRGKLYIITDGGMNQFLRPVLMDLNHPTLIVTKLGELETNTADIGGPLCTPLDVIASEVEIPEVEVGDIVGLFNAGAYGFSMSMMDFLGHPRPSEILLYNGHSHLIRRRGAFKDITRHQEVPPDMIEELLISETIQNEDNYE
jgi:diaminopimelate decarboxylase